MMIIIIVVVIVIMISSSNGNNSSTSSFFFFYGCDIVSCGFWMCVFCNQLLVNWDAMLSIFSMYLGQWELVSSAHVLSG